MTERRHDAAPGRAVHTGTVREFDDDAGLGVIEASGHEFPFHCIEIADGSRHIERGTQVTFGIIAKLGRREAVAISPAHDSEHAAPRA